MEKVQGNNPLQPVLRAMTTIKILTMINCRHASCYFSVISPLRFGQSMLAGQFKPWVLSTSLEDI